MKICLRTCILLLSTMAVFASRSVGADVASNIPEQKFVFKTWSGKEVECFRGSFEVPENRAASHSRLIPIKYVRFPATGERSSPPIVYLAGGPGASGIQAVNYRFEMFMALRRFGDVIALDQRGTGESNVVPEYRSKIVLPAATAYSDAVFIDDYRRAFQDALVFWKQTGADVAGYNTVQNALDLDSLRQHLHAQKIVLWGVSYGSHLALAALKEIGDKVDRVILSSAEGLDQTIKCPAQTENYFDRLQVAVDTEPDARAAYPDIKALIRRVNRQLELKPVAVTLRQDKTTFQFLLQRRDLQMLAGALISDPEQSVNLLRIYRALDRGLTPSFDRIPSRYLPDHFTPPGEPIILRAMDTLMDVASGLGRERKAEVEREAPTALLGDWLDFSQHYDGIAPELDLGDGYRTEPRSDVPVLLLSGTLDGRTDIENQRKAVAGLRHVTFVTVENGGHNLPFTADIQAIVDRFMESKPAAQTAVRLKLPNFSP